HLLTLRVCTLLFNDTAAADISSLSLHDALPISPTGCRTWRCSTSHCPCPEPLRRGPAGAGTAPGRVRSSSRTAPRAPPGPETPRDRKSTRLNSSHVKNSYAVFCLKKKKIIRQPN